VKQLRDGFRHTPFTPLRKLSLQIATPLSNPNIEKQGFRVLLFSISSDVQLGVLIAFATRIADHLERVPKRDGEQPGE